MKNLTYHGPGVLLRVAGREIPRGGTEQVPNADAERLLEDPNYDVTVTETDDEPEAEIGEGHPNSESENEEAP